MPLALAFIDSPEQLLVILAILLLIFGPSKLPQLGASMGKTIKAFRESAKEVGAEANVPPQTAAQPVQPVSPAGPSVTCPKCGTVAAADAQFCTRCGTKLA
jgi:sec-independent protein translocase protein TatA